MQLVQLPTFLPLTLRNSMGPLTASYLFALQASDETCPITPPHCLMACHHVRITGGCRIVADET